MEKILSDFGVQPVLLLAQVVNFAVLLFILKKLVYKPVIKMLETRKQKIAEGLENAEKINEELQAIEDRKQKEIDLAIEEGKKIIAEASENANQIIAEAHIKAQSDMNLMMEEGKQMIEGEKEKMKAEVKSEVAEMIGMSLEKVLGKTLDSKTQQKIAQDSIKEIRV